MVGRDRLPTMATVILRWEARDQVNMNKLGQRRAMVGVLLLQSTGEDHLAHLQHLVMVGSLRLARRPTRRDMQDSLLLVHHPILEGSIDNHHLEVTRLEAMEGNHLGLLQHQASTLGRDLTLTLEATIATDASPLPELIKDSVCEPSRLHHQCRKSLPMKVLLGKR